MFRVADEQRLPFDVKAEIDRPILPRAAAAFSLVCASIRALTMESAVIPIGLNNAGGPIVSARSRFRKGYATDLCGALARSGKGANLKRLLIARRVATSIV